MFIRLHDIPKEGIAYHLNRKSGELNKILADVLENADYQIDMHIRPMDTFYLVEGEAKVYWPDVCSKCGDEVKTPVAQKINEILVPEAELDRVSSYAKTPSDLNVGAPQVTTYSDGELNCGEMLHELVAISYPEFPLCGGDRCLHADEANEALERLNQESKKFDHVAAPQSPFNILKNLKA